MSRGRMEGWKGGRMEGSNSRAATVPRYCAQFLLLFSFGLRVDHKIMIQMRGVAVLHVVASGCMQKLESCTTRVHSGIHVYSCIISIVLEYILNLEYYSLFSKVLNLVVQLLP